MGVSRFFKQKIAYYSCCLPEIASDSIYINTENAFPQLYFENLPHSCSKMLAFMI